MHRYLLVSMVAVLCCFTSISKASDTEELLGQQVHGCGTSFGEQVAADLIVAYQYNLRAGDVGAVAARKTVASIKSMLPARDSLEGYRFYLTCLSNKLSASLQDVTEGSLDEANADAQPFPNYQDVTSICTGIDDSRLAMKLADSSQQYDSSFAAFGIEDSRTLTVYRYCIHTFVIN